MKRLDTAFVFAGQGCQYSGMAAAALETDASFRRTIKELDTMVRAGGGPSVLDALQRLGKFGRKPGGALLDSHLAIFCVQYAAACATRRKGVHPRVVLGYSLGEIVALAVAGILSVEDALALVRRQAEVIARRVERGHLVAVLGDECAAPEALSTLPPRVELAGRNWPGHLVYAVPVEGLAEFEAEMSRRGALALRLPVEYPFHSARLEPAREELLESMARLEFRTAVEGFFSVTAAEPREHADPLHVWRTIREPVNFPAAVRALCSTECLRFLDLSPNASMRLMVSKNVGAGAQVAAAFDPFRGGRLTL